MAGRKRKKQNKKRTRGGWIALKILAVIVVLLGLVIGYGMLNANTVHVRYAKVTSDDLPSAFDGTKVLFVSDIDLCGINSPEKMAKLFKRLQALEPDVLLLGGDYTSTSIIDILNRTDGSGKAILAREAFFRAIEDFDAPLGKYAVAGENDIEVKQLSNILEETGIKPLFNGYAGIKKDGDVIHVLGFNANTSGINFNEVAGKFRKDDYVIALAHSPAAFPQILTAEAKDSGNWADLMLAGHTHGGQIRLMDKNILQMTEQEKSFLYGWKRENSSRLLTSSGVGCESANIRIGSSSEVWLITLSDGSVDLPDLSL